MQLTSRTNGFIHDLRSGHIPVVLDVARAPKYGRAAAEATLIKSAVGATAYLVEQANKTKWAQLANWHKGVIDGARLGKNDPRLVFRRTMFAMPR
jgi:hypothetical protein